MPHPLDAPAGRARRLGLNVREGMWLRLIDLRAALEARSYAAAGSLTFEVTDEFCPWNAGRWRLEVAGDGRGTLTASDADPDLTLDTADLATVYLGTFTFADLARAGPGGGVPARGRGRSGSVVRHGDGAVVLDDVLTRAIGRVAAI